jgi:hypothetical protein
MLLVETRRTPPPSPGEPERQPWEPNWRLWGWIALTVVAFVGAKVAAGVVSYVLICLTLVCVCRAIGVVLPPLDGLRHHRQ